MAPEAILGADVDRRVDIYALGCLMYFLLTGRTVFHSGSSMGQLLQHVHETPLPPSHRTEQPIPRAIDDLVMACLEKDPNRRPRDAEELLHLFPAPEITGGWDHESARQWWERHLPHLTASRMSHARQVPGSRFQVPGSCSGLAVPPCVDAQA
jgi:serine/threonine-protein kinase